MRDCMVHVRVVCVVGSFRRVVRQWLDNVSIGQLQSCLFVDTFSLTFYWDSPFAVVGVPESGMRLVTQV